MPRMAVESCQEAFRDSVSWRFCFALQRGDLASGSRRKRSPTDPESLTRSVDKDVIAAPRVVSDRSRPRAAEGQVEREWVRDEPLG